VQSFDYLKVDVSDGIATVVFTDPVNADFFEKRHPLHRELRDVFPALLHAPDVRAAILTGEGDVFYAGPTLEANLRIIEEQPSIARDWMIEARDICANMIGFSKPLVAAVNGDAIAMGLQFAFLADFAIAVDGVKFQDTHVRVGLPAGDGGALMWPLLVGIPRARTMLLRGVPMTATQLADLGLLADVVASADDLIPAARDLAERLARIPPRAFAATKISLNQWFRLGTLVAGDVSAALQISAFADPEFRDTLAALVERQRG
jgi:enoyl-CoA hydratase